MMHILFAEDLVDHAFMKKYTIGRDELKQEAASYTPEVVSAITGVSQKDLYELARMYGKVEPAFIRIGNGISTMITAVCVYVPLPVFRLLPASG